MQLEPPDGTAALRTRLNALACALLTAGLPAAASADAAPSWRFEGSGLIYGERGRTNVVEPIARITRLLPDGQSLSAQLGIDAITGASPSGALPSGRIQTTTTPSGNVRTLPAGQIPVGSFKDIRGSLDLEWSKPFWGHLTATTGAHGSREKDYQSLGANEALNLEFMHRLTTLTVGAGIHRDSVFPRGGTPVGLSGGGELLNSGSNPKRVRNGVLGLSRVLTRRWMVGVTGSRADERGYLTEPYKVISIMDERNGYTVGQLTEKRPSRRVRSDVLASSVYHLRDGIVYLSYRYYWDSWRVRSSTFDVKYRRRLQDGAWLQPHLRYYAQSPADFFTFGLVRGSPVPAFASSDYRLGRLKGATVGATYGFRIPDRPGEWSIRAEYMRQWGDRHAGGVVGVQRDFALTPPVNVGTLLVTYTIEF